MGIRTILARRRSGPLVGLVSLVVAIVVLLGPVVASPALAGDAYFRGSDIPLDNPDWMGDLPDDVLLSQLSLPGTHDTMARGCDSLATCQDTSLADQLRAGIRALDIRCASDSGPQGNFFSLWHGPYCYLGTFDQVATECRTYLASHSGETIVMRIKQELALTNPKLSFSDMFKWYRDEYPGLFADTGDGRTIPTLGQVRGKVVVLQDYDYSPLWGIRYVTPDFNPPFNSSGHAEVHPSKADFEAKWQAIHDHLFETNAGNRTSIWYVNWLSGGTFTEPYRVAGGYSNGFSAAGMNDRMFAIFQGSALVGPPSGSDLATVPLTCTGTMMMDFPGPGLIQAIINLNEGARPRFTDVSGSSYETAIYQLSGQGIILGFLDATFRPNDTVIRQQFAKMIVRTLDLPVTGAEICPFGDVVPQTGTDPFYPSKYVAVAAKEGVTYGYPDGTFMPYRDIRRLQVITMIVRAAENLFPGTLEDPPAGWSGQLSYSDLTHGANLKKADYNGLLSGLQGLSGSWNGYASASRGECAQLLYNLLQRM